MIMTCNECGGQFRVNQVVGTTPMNVELKAYCGDKCLSDNVEKNKPKPNAAV